jgi:hypothetical protein
MVEYEQGERDYEPIGYRKVGNVILQIYKDGRGQKHIETGMAASPGLRPLSVAERILPIE